MCNVHIGTVTFLSILLSRAPLLKIVPLVLGCVPLLLNIAPVLLRISGPPPPPPDSATI